MQSRKDASVAIIGAGVAGLSAADALINRHGFTTVKIYEASDRIGGRILTVNFGDGKVEMGAQYVQKVPNSPIFKFAKEKGLLCKTEPLNVALRQDGTVVDKKLADSFWDFALSTEGKADRFGKLLPKKADHSFGSVMRYRYDSWRLKQAKKAKPSNLADFDRLLLFAEKVAELDYGCVDWSDVSTVSSKAFNTGGQQVELVHVDHRKGGYGTFVQHIAQRLPKDSVKLNHLVTGINWVGPRVELDFENGTGTSVDHVIVTVPVGCLKQFGHQMFSPPLPTSKILALDGIGFGAVEKVFARFTEPFWNPNVATYDLLWDKPQGWESEELSLARSFSILQIVPALPNVICLWATGPAVDVVYTTTDNELALAIQALVRTFFVNADNVAPIEMTRSRWGADYLFLGSYSHYNLNYDVHRHGPKQLGEPLYGPDDETPLVLFAGEATSVDSYGTTHGAYLSGQREAMRLNQLYQKNHKHNDKKRGFFK